MTQYCWESPLTASGATRLLPRTGICTFRCCPTLSRRGGSRSRTVPTTRKWARRPERYAAKVTLVEYGDCQCPYCGAAHPMVKRLQSQLGDELRLVFRNFPLAEMHPQALTAAMTAEFAATHG